MESLLGPEPTVRKEGVGEAQKMKPAGWIVDDGKEKAVKVASWVVKEQKKSLFYSLVGFSKTSTKGQRQAEEWLDRC